MDDAIRLSPGPSDRGSDWRSLQSCEKGPCARPPDTKSIGSTEDDAWRASDAQRLDECRERGWMLATARVIQEEAGERGHQSSSTRTSAPLARCEAACSSDMNARPTPLSAARVSRPMSFVISGPLIATTTD